MIGRIDIRANAAHPNFPLPPVYMFAGAPSSPRVFGVPCRVGSWAITAVSVAVAYPDNSTRTVALTQTDGTWIGVIPACATTGAVQSGFQIVADGTDENGDAVTGYCLGVGDLFVMARDFTATADGTRYYFHYCETAPTTPQVGDAAYIDGALQWWDGSAWRAFGGATIDVVPPSTDAAAAGKAADAKAVGDALYTGFTEWELTTDNLPQGSSFRGVVWYESQWVVNIFDGIGEIGIPTGEGADAVSIIFEYNGSTNITTRHLITPTKTSQLTNDGAPNGGGTPYATTAQIPDVTGKADKVSGATAGNLAALNAQGNLADSGAKVSDFATPSDLPYALVTPGEWEFSGLPSRWEITDISYELGDWTITYLIDGGEATDVISTQGAEDALSLTFAYSEEIHITATRASLPGHLLDRSGNRVVVTGDTTLTLPALEHAGRLRDFLVRLEISGSTVPTITFASPTGEKITYETDGDEFPVPDEAGTWSYSFTENCVAHKFAVSLKKVNEVAQGGS